MAALKISLWLGVIFLLTFLLQTHIFISADIAWLLHVTQQLLAGGHYNQDFFETNPPLILFLYTPVVLVHKMVFINQFTIFRIYIALLALGSLILCNSILNKIFFSKDSLIKASTLITIAVCFLLLPVREFGQREHLMVVFSLPYFLIAVLRAQNSAVDYKKLGRKRPSFFQLISLSAKQVRACDQRGEYRFSPLETPSGCVGSKLPSLSYKLALLCGLLAGIGFAIKPYFFMAPLLVEIYLAIRHKSICYWLRTETIAIFVFVICYLLSIIIFTPEYLQDTLPLVNSLYFSGLPFASWQLLFTLPTLGWLLTLIVYQINKKDSLYPEYESILMLAATGFFLLYILQRTKWYYHWLPCLIICTLLLVKILITNAIIPKQTVGWISCILQRNPPFAGGLRRIARLIHPTFTCKYLLPCFALIVFTLFNFEDLVTKALANYFSQQGFINTLQTTMKKYVHQGSVYFLYPFVDGAYPAVDYAGVNSASRFPGLIYLPGLYNLTVSDNKQIDRDKLEQEKNYLINAVVEDFATQQPNLVFVDRETWLNYFGGKPFNYLQFFSADPRFVKIFACYTFLSNVENFAVYQRKSLNCKMN